MSEKEVCVYGEGDAAVTFLPPRTSVRPTLADWISQTGSEASIFLQGQCKKKCSIC